MEDKALFKAPLQRKCKVACATGGGLTSLADKIYRWLTDSYTDNDKTDFTPSLLQTYSGYLSSV